MKDEYQQYLNEVSERINTTDSIIPAQRAAFKAGFSFSNLPFSKQLEIWNYIWFQSTTFRQKIHAFFFLEQNVRHSKYHREIWATSVNWQEQINDWPLCDGLSKINTKVLESFPGEVYSQLMSWNTNNDLWKRRQSLVSLLYYSRTKKIYLSFEQIAALIAPLLTDKEYYVQKGVGWALRELHTVYPAASLPFLQKNIKNISAIAFTIAIEKMNTGEKDDLKRLRKK